MSGLFPKLGSVAPRSWRAYGAPLFSASFELLQASGAKLDRRPSGLESFVPAVVQISLYLARMVCDTLFDWSGKLLRYRTFVSLWGAFFMALI